MHKFSVIIPFRDRHEHLSVLVPHLRDFANGRGIEIEIIIAEQSDDEPLRRGALRNEGARVATGDILVLHDVDYLPADDAVYWTENTDVFRPVQRVEFITMDGSQRLDEDVPSGYRHFKKTIDNNFFGGVLCIRADAYRMINGYNPMYRGWGLEDDDFRERIIRSKLRVTSGIGLFRALPHPDSFRNDDLFRQNQTLFQNREAFDNIGMNCGTLIVNTNYEKQKKYGVDKWLEVTQWSIPTLTRANLPNVSFLDYGIFATMENVQLDHVQRAIAQGNRWEPSIMALCEKYAQPNTTVVDIGANMGTFTVRLGQLVGPKGSVIAFEPQRVMYQQMCCNVFLNKLRNVHAHQVAIGKEHGDVYLTPIDYDRGAPGEVRIHGSSGERVSCAPLDDYELRNVSLIKIDVERYEPFVFDGARKTIEENRPVILFELTTLPLPDYPEDYVVRMLSELNYNIYEVSEWGDYLGIPVEKDDNS